MLFKGDISAYGLRHLVAVGILVGVLSGFMGLLEGYGQCLSERSVFDPEVAEMGEVNEGSSVEIGSASELDDRARQIIEEREQFLRIIASIPLACIAAVSIGMNMWQTRQQRRMDDMLDAKWRNPLVTSENA